MSVDPPTNPNESANRPLNEDPKTWEHWIKGIGFGIYILAALGILFYAVTLRQIGWNWTELRPYVVGLIAVGAVLYLLSFGKSTLKSANVSDHIKNSVAAILLVLFIAIIAIGVLWVAILILRDALNPGPGQGPKDSISFTVPETPVVTFAVAARNIAEQFAYSVEFNGCDSLQSLPMKPCHVTFPNVRVALEKLHLHIDGVVPQYKVMQDEANYIYRIQCE